ncbi:MAG: DUF1294 domain-containing protein [Pseudomonadota bacterium]
MTLAAIVLVIAAVASAVGGALFVLDKRAAIAGRRRVPERVLLLCAAAGAAPIMLWLAGKIRHKTQKEPFRTLLRAILAAQVLAAFGLIAHAAGVI